MAQEMSRSFHLAQGQQIQGATELTDAFLHTCYSLASGNEMFSVQPVLLYFAGVFKNRYLLITFRQASVDFFGEGVDVRC